MSVRTSQLRSLSSFLLPISKGATNPLTTAIQTRCLHHRIAVPQIPAPTPFVPDTQTFLTLIGRNLSQHASKIPTWEALFSLTSAQLRELGVDPPRSRRYLLRWREKYRNGEFGIGGEAKEVVDGVAEVRVVEVPVAASQGHTATVRDQIFHGTATATRSPGMKKIIVNTPVGKELSAEEITEAVRMKGLKIRGASTITGPWVKPLGQGVARIAVQEGLWEDRRGRKVDGGERRQAEVRAKRRAEERRTSR